MGRVNIGTARIVIVLALVVAGVAVLANGFGGAAAVAPPTGGGSPSASGSPSTSASPTKIPHETPSPQVQGVLIAVFNGTNETGLAGQVQQTLEADGYVAAQDPADAPSKPVAKTIVYFRGGANASQNRSDAKHVAVTYFGGAHVALLGTEQTSAVTIDKSAQVVIIVGVDYANLVANP